MKKLIKYMAIIPAAAALLCISACEEIEPVVEELTFSRAFTPVGLEARISNVITVTLTWSVAKNTDHYVIEIYDGTEAAPGSLVHTADVAGDLTAYSYVLPAGDTQFFAKVKSVSALEGVAESKWISVEFKSEPENLFTGYVSEMTGLGECIVRWTPGSAATALVFDAGTPSTITLEAADVTAGTKAVTGLSKGSYQVTLMNGAFVRGRTTIILEGDAFVAQGEDLAAAIASAAAGDVILLENGATFSFAGPVTLNTSLKIRGVMSANLPVIFTVLNAATYHMFTIGAGITPADSLVFQNLTISGYPDDNTANTRLRGMFDQETSNPCDLGLLRFENCVARNFDRHLVRLRGTAVQVINTIAINNCILYDYAFGSHYGVINSSQANGKILNIRYTNSTVYNIRGGIIQYTNGTACDGIVVSNCTFNQVVMDPSTARYFIDMNNTTGAGTIAISNCLFGNTSAIANGIRPNTMTLTFSGSYYTSDFNDGLTFPVKSYMTAYSGASTDLWVDPLTERDFHFLDAGFIGRSSSGDPRWRQ